MSGYLFMVADQNNLNGPQVNYYRKRYKLQTKANDEKTTTSKTSRRSSISSKTSSKPVDTNPATEIVSKNSIKYNKADFKYHEKNRSLNHYRSKQGILFSEKNVNILRYTFYKSITSNYNEIIKDMAAKQDDGTPKLKYMCKIKENKKKAQSLVKGLPKLTSDNSKSNVNEVDEVMEDFGEDKRFLSQNELCIKELIKSNQFWNNVYQDLKYNLMDLSSTFNYFDLLPNIDQLLRLYREVSEYFLLNLLDIEYQAEVPKTTQTDKSSRENTENCWFYYLPDFCYEWFKVMADVHLKIFNNQSVMNTNLTSFQEIDLSMHQHFVLKIISTIVDNFRICLGYQARHLDPIFDLWEDFLTYVIFELIIGNYNHNEELNTTNKSLLVQNLERADSVDSIFTDFSFHNTTITTPDIDQLSALSEDNVNMSVLTRNTKNLSINTYLSITPISRIPEEDEVPCSNKDPTNKVSGIVLEPPAKRVLDHVISNPVPPFSVNAPETIKLHSKRLFFSRLKRTKK